MADEAKTDRREAAPEEQGAKKKFNLKSVLLIGGFALGQAIFVVVVLWFARSATTAPAPAQAAGPQAQDEMVTVPVLPAEPDAKIRAVNARSGQLVYWSVKVSVRVPKAQEKQIRERLAANADLVKQEITTVIAACDPVILEQEADHATVKRQICFALNNILGKSTISEVVIPECLPARMD